MFDATFNWGTILTILMAAVGIMAFLWTIRSDLNVIVERMKHFDDNVDSIGARMGNFETQMEKLADAMVSIARQEERLNGQERRMTMSQEGIDKRFGELQAHVLSLAERMAGNAGKKRTA